MLGLRKGFQSISGRRLRSRGSSASSSLNADGTDEPQPQPATPATDQPSRSLSAMDTIRAGLQESVQGLAGKGHKSSDAVVSVKDVTADSASDKTVSMKEESSTALTKVRTSNSHSTSTTTIQVTRLSDTTRSIRAHICKLGDYSEHWFKTLDLESYLEYISDERLIHMPRRGSDWDRVLRTAQFFGYQLSTFGDRIGDFCPGTEAAAITALGSTQILLEIGPGQAQALAPTFQALYELTLLISYVSQIHDVFNSSREVRETLAHLYCDIVELVGDISVYYRRKISNLKPHETVTINFEATFGASMAGIWKRRDHLTSRLWSIKLSSKSYRLSLESVRRRLKSDRSAQGAFYDQVHESLKRAEDTCEWLKPSLTEFFRSNDKALTITGDSGCGKTVLAGWVKERLQRPLDHVQYSTLTYNFPYDAPAKCTVLAFLKSILFQLLEKNVGDVELYGKLVDSLDAYDKHHTLAKLEASLWVALESGLKTLNDRHVNLALIVDGFHELRDEKMTPLEFHKTLRQRISGFQHIRMITLSKPISHLSDGCYHFTITPQHLQNDIKAYFRQSFSRLAGFAGLSSGDKDKVVAELATKAKVSFLWAYIVVRILVKENATSSAEGFAKSAHNIGGSLDEQIKKLVSKLSFKDETTRTLLAFMLVADRPLAVSEMAELLRLNVQGRKFGSGKVDVPKHISDHVKDIVVIEQGSLHFKSKSIRTYLWDTQMGKSLPSIKDAHKHLTSVLLLYSKLVLCHSDGAEPSLDLLGDGAVDELFHAHPLLYYAVKHWRAHFKSSGYYSSKGEIVLTKDFHEYFPGSCHFALLERAVCAYGLPASKLLEHHEFSLKVRESCFGEKHLSVLQTLIIIGNIHVHVGGNTLDGAKYFYRVVNLGQVVLSKFSTIVVACTSLFLEYTATITITKRTEIVIYREKMILLIIEICKHKHGSTSDIVIKWYKVLADLYVKLKEEHEATLIYKVLYEIYVTRFGKHSHQASGLREHLGELEISITGRHDIDMEEYAGFFLETSDELEFHSEKRICVLLQLAVLYETQKQWHLAEKIYITLWRRISEICRLKATVELHILKLNITIAYIEFLRKLKRKEEACNILICLWVEYEHHSFEDETIIIRIREIGKLFKVFGMLELAISILTKVWGWFKSKGKVTDGEAGQTTILITEVVEEITETTVVTKTTTTTTVVKEIYETHFNRCKQGKADKHFFDACLALVNLYIKLENWAEAEIIIRQSLEITWKAILTADVNIKLSETCITECIAVATRLAVCYRRQGWFEKAEAIYLRIFRACLVSLQIEDVRIQETLAVLIEFYEEHHRHEKVIEVYIELLAKYRKQLGHSHRLTIKTLYVLAGHCRLLGRSDAYEYYMQIVTTLNQGKKHCHHDAFEAAVMLIKYYHERKSWTELQHLCAVLWETFVHHHKEFHFTEEVITLIYEKYIYVLEYHAKVDIQVLYEISVKFRETVTIVFGASSAILITAMMALAKICERHEKHYHEAVTIYEEIIKTTTTTVTETIITTVKKRLSKVYVTIITTGKPGSTTTTTIERALVLCLEAYAELKLKLGVWHETTLHKLKDIIIIYQKLGGKTCSHHAKIMDLLHVAFIGIATTTTCGSVALYQAGCLLSEIYIAAGLCTYGLKLVQQLRHQIIFGISGSGFDFDSVVLHKDLDVIIKLDAHNHKSIAKTAFVFLVSLEQHLHAHIKSSVLLTYSEVMASTLLEISLYESYKSILTTSSTKNVEIFIILEHGAKLRSFWVEQKHQDQMISVLDKKLFALFKARYISHLSGIPDDALFLLYLSILSSLAGKDYHSYLTQQTKTFSFPALVCRSANAQVLSLLKSSNWAKALDVAKASFTLIHRLGWYDSLAQVQYSYKLAEYLAGIDAPHPAQDNKLWQQYLSLSREITNCALSIFREKGIDFVRLKFADLAGIVRLLGSQENYVELEGLLLKLWRSREVQKNWTSSRVLAVGKMMVHAHVAAKNIPAAIELCDRMCYNLRRSRGVLDPVTVEMTQMLGALYTTDGRVDRAMGLAEGVLREIDSLLRESEKAGVSSRPGGPRRAVSVCYLPAPNGKGVDGTAAEGENGAGVVKAEDLAKTAAWQLELLKRSYLRLGGWTKPEQEFTNLYQRLVSRLGKAGLSGQSTSPESWAKQAKGGGSNKPDDLIGKYVGLRTSEWTLDTPDANDDGHVHRHGGDHFGIAEKNGNGTVTKDKRRWTVDHVLVASQEWLAV
ncbi:hypothetical protein V8F33_012155 [Rhypophila sp. PSN 637]